MVSLEQVKLLESKVTRAIDYLKTVTEEKILLKEKLDSYQKRIDELEILIQRFKEDQSRIEDGILSALDRLNQFEDALESKLSPESKLSVENRILPEGLPSAETNTGPAPRTSEAEEKNSEPALGELDIF